MTQTASGLWSHTLVPMVPEDKLEKAARSQGQTGLCHFPAPFPLQHCFFRISGKKTEPQGPCDISQERFELAPLQTFFYGLGEPLGPRGIITAGMCLRGWAVGLEMSP